MFGSVNISECVTYRGNICSSAERTALFFGFCFWSEFGSLNTFLDCQKVTYYVFVIFLCHTFPWEMFVGLECFEHTCLMFID